MSAKRTIRFQFISQRILKNLKSLIIKILILILIFVGETCASKPSKIQWLKDDLRHIPPGVIVEDSYIHKSCKKITKMSREIAETVYLEPDFYAPKAFCASENQPFHLSEFTYVSSGENMYSKYLSRVADNKFQGNLIQSENYILEKYPKSINSNLKTSTNETNLKSTISIVGNVTYSIPPNWGKIENGRNTFLDAEDCPSGKICRLSLMTSIPMKDNFRDMFELFQKPDPIIQTTGVVAGFDSKGRETLRETKEVQDRGSSIYRAYYAIKINNNFVWIFFTASNKEILKKYYSDYEFVAESLDTVK